MKNIDNIYLLIVGERHELLNGNDRIIVIDGNGRDIYSFGKGVNYCASGGVILCLCCLKQDINTSQYKLCFKIASMLKGCKENTIKGHSDHFGSTGNYYPFGNRAK